MDFDTFPFVGVTSSFCTFCGFDNYDFYATSFSIGPFLQQYLSNLNIAQRSREFQRGHSR